VNAPAPCDVLVVGAGPAGSSAARAAADEGARVVLVDRRQAIGVPVQCAEYIPAMLRVDEASACAEACVQEIRGLRTFVRGEPAGGLNSPGYTIDRDRFDQLLAAAAERAGAQLLTATEALPCERRTVVLRRKGLNTLTLRPRVVVGADGPLSTVARWVGIIAPSVVAGVQARVRLARPMDMAEVYLHPDFRGGYAWLFPKGEHANAGVAFVSAKGRHSVSSALARFVHELTSQGKITGSVLARTAGWIPISSPSATLRRHVVLAGDAAGQTHPITGAGVYNAIVGGRIAGTWAARAALADDTRLLEHSQEEWQDVLGETMARAKEKRLFMEANWERFDDTIRSCWITFREYYV